MIVVTGAAGFIGSCMIRKLNEENFNAIVAVDDFSRVDKAENLHQKRILANVDREAFFTWLEKNHRLVEFIFHLGARTDTTEFNWQVFQHLNVDYSKKIWQKCIDYQIPLVYASSAATYGMGELGYRDDDHLIPQLQPLNPYGKSKNDFDQWVLKQQKQPFFWAGLKFFNVYGPNEYHKGRMASVVWHAFQQIEKSGKMKLFKSHHPQFEDGKQKRDFIYVKDVVDVCYYLMHHRRNAGIYNLGTGKARTFLDLTKAVFSAMQLDPNIEFIDTPKDIRYTYQYFTEATMDKLKSVGYEKAFTTIEDGVADYVQQYLLNKTYY